jgi:predicted nucleic acid-binding protein
MEWIERLKGATVGLDTAPLIYFIERHPKYLPLVRPFFEAMQSGEIRVVTSTLTLTEVLIHPYRRGDRALAGEYSDILLNAPNLTMLPVSPEIADHAARLRAAHGMKTPDSIQLAAALAANATAFLTNDTAIETIHGLEILVLDKLMTTPTP